MTREEVERKIFDLESLVFSSIPIDRVDHLEPLLADLSVSIEPQNIWLQKRRRNLTPSYIPYSAALQMTCRLENSPT